MGHDSRRGTIELIARAVIQSGAHLLLCRNRRGIYFLPGGHVEFNETASIALARELSEELGITAVVGPCLAIQEHLFEQEGVPRHELNLMFHVEHHPSTPLSHPAPPTSREPALTFEWVDLATLPETDLRPIEIKAWLMAAAEPGRPVEWIGAG